MRDSEAVSVGIRPVRKSVNAGCIEWRSPRCGETRANAWEKPRTQASQGVNTVDVHSARTTDTLTARAAESQSRVNFVLNTDESVEHHGAGLLQVELVALHGGLLARGVRIPAVDLEGLHGRVLRGDGVDILSGLDGGIGASKSGGPEQRARRSEESRCSAQGGHDGRR
jgi:hypothetical protein